DNETIFNLGDEDIEPATKPQLPTHEQDKQPKHNRERERNPKDTQQCWNRGRHEIVRVSLPESEKSEQWQEEQQSTSLQQPEENHHRQSRTCFVARVLKKTTNVRCHFFRCPRITHFRCFVHLIFCD